MKIRTGALVSFLMITSLASFPVALRAQTAPPSFKLAFWNIKSGKGQVALPGHPATFVDTANCTDPTQPLNAWGVNLVQNELVAKIKNDPQIVALGLAEAWTCGSPERVRAVLGWAARTNEQNGVAIVARYGFAGAAEWRQLDTSLAPNPGDTKWVRTPVCLDAGCTAALNVFTAHWSASNATADIQAQQTIAFLAALPAMEPHVLMGDFNVWEGTESVCNQSPQNTALGYLRSAAYTDAWPHMHGAAEGYT